MMGEDAVVATYGVKVQLGKEWLKLQKHLSLNADFHPTA